MISIKYTDVGYFASPSVMDEDTGFFPPEYYTGVKCRINFSADKIVNYNGEEILTSAKVYLPPSAKISLKHKFKLENTDDARVFHIQSIEYKKDVNGKVNHVVVFV